MTDVKTKKTQLVFSGGGAKGIAYVGVYQALHDAQVMDNVGEVSGISAGSIMATMVAFGVDPNQVRQELFQHNLSNLLGQRSRNKQPHALRFLSRDGQPIIEFVDRILKAHLLSYFESQAAQLSELPEEHPIKMLSTRLVDPNTHTPITFKDLKNLHTYDDKKFKRLYIAACDVNKQLIPYNDSATPTTSIAEACRASAAIPGILTPHRDHNDRAQFDGGLNTNFLTEHLADSVDSEPQDRLIFAFAASTQPGKQLDHVQQIIHSSRWHETIDFAILKNLIQETLDDFKSQDKFDRRASFQDRLLEKIKKHPELPFKAYQQLLGLEKSLLPERLITMLIATRVGDATENENRAQTITDIYQNACAENYIKQFKIKFKHQCSERFVKNMGIQGQSLALYKRDDAIKLHRDALHVVNVQIGNVTTTNFRLANRRKHQLAQTAYVNTMMHLRNYGRIEEEHSMDRIIPAFYSCSKLLSFNSSTHRWISALKSQKPNNAYVELNQFRCIFPEHRLSKVLLLIENYQQQRISKLEFTEQLYILTFEHSHFLARSQSLGATFYRTSSLKKHLKSMTDEEKSRIFLSDPLVKNSRLSQVLSAIRDIERFIHPGDQRLDAETTSSSLPRS
jgi:predicted acylesterase/phospholipase RssA